MAPTRAKKLIHPEPEPPWLPQPSEIELPNGERLRVRVCEGPHDKRSARRLAPIVLIHGWTITADIAWYEIYPRLAKRHTYASFDMRGHGVGLRPEHFTLEDCADDVIAVADALGWAQIVPVGYSMGGTIAQLVAHRHPERCAGLVLCSTAAVFVESHQDRFFFEGFLGTTVRALNSLPKLIRERVPGRVRAFATGNRGLGAWMEQEVRAHDARLVAEAGREIGRFNSESWLHELTMPSAVVITSGDKVIPPTRQRQLAAMLPDATTFSVAADHTLTDSEWEPWWEQLDKALESVTKRQANVVQRTARATTAALANSVEATRRSVEHLMVTGRVQGVGFRQSMQRRAQELGVRGWVRNRRDGRVEAVLDGEPEQIESLRDWARNGPPMAAVTGVQSWPANSVDTPEHQRPSTGFEIRPTE